MMTPEQILKIAKECGADFEQANSEIVNSYASDVLIFSPNAIEAFAKAIQQCGDGEPVALNMALTKMKELPRFSFLSPREGGVRRFTDKSGNWIEQYEAVKILDDLISEVE